MGILSNFVNKEIENKSNIDDIYKGIETGFENYFKQMTDAYKLIVHPAAGSIITAASATVLYIDTCKPNITFVSPKSYGLGNKIKQATKNAKDYKEGLNKLLGAIGDYLSSEIKITCTGTLTLQTSIINNWEIKFPINPNTVSNVTAAAINAAALTKSYTFKTSWDIINTNLLPIFNMNICNPDSITNIGAGTVPAGSLSGSTTPIKMVFT